MCPWISLLLPRFMPLLLSRLWYIAKCSISLISKDRELWVEKWGASVSQEGPLPYMSPWGYHAKFVSASPPTLHHVSKN